MFDLNLIPGIVYSFLNTTMEIINWTFVITKKNQNIIVFELNKILIKYLQFAEYDRNIL